MPAPDGVSTEVHVLLVYDIPGGKLGQAVARYFGEEGPAGTGRLAYRVRPRC
ncbi:hypothetical protein [Micromonospora sp. NPDC049102]|uniref:hypothetical protein n=1 Tax=Micromonospora sp. NPDC049102 TaxID=3364265 RepID=UPI00371C447C